MCLYSLKKTCKKSTETFFGGKYTLGIGLRLSPIRSLKISSVEFAKYLDGWPLCNNRYCKTTSELCTRQITITNIVIFRHTVKSHRKHRFLWLKLSSDEPIQFGNEWSLRNSWYYKQSTICLPENKLSSK